MTLQFGNVSFSAGGRVKLEVPGKKPVQEILNPPDTKIAARNHNKNSKKKWFDTG